MGAFVGSWKDTNLQIKCVQQAVKLIKKYIKEIASKTNFRLLAIFL